jgi:hypothetical protein
MHRRQQLTTSTALRRTPRWLAFAALVPLACSLAAHGPALPAGAQDRPIPPASQPPGPSLLNLEASPRSELRAFNFARNYGVRLNGGLGKYHPQACMFDGSAPENPCLVRRDGEGFTFRFLGGPPGWHAQGAPATVETELTISPDGTGLVRLLYNGAPRSR